MTTRRHKRNARAGGMPEQERSQSRSDAKGKEKTQQQRQERPVSWRNARARV